MQTNFEINILKKWDYFSSFLTFLTFFFHLVPINKEFKQYIELWRYNVLKRKHEFQFPQNGIIFSKVSHKLKYRSTVKYIV